MKSVIAQGSTVAKAIEEALKKAEMPQEFFVKLLEDAQGGFLGFGAKKAKIALFFKEETQANRHQETIFERGQYESLFNNPSMRKQIDQQLKEMGLEIKPIAQQSKKTSHQPQQQAPKPQLQPMKQRPLHTPKPQQVSQKVNQQSSMQQPVIEGERSEQQQGQQENFRRRRRQRYYRPRREQQAGEHKSSTLEVRPLNNKPKSND